MLLLKKIFQPTWFRLLLTITCVHQIMQKVLHIAIPLIDAYLDPLCLMPILLHLLVWERRTLYKKREQFTFSTTTLLLYFIFISIITEILFPALQPKFTADWLDVVCYAVGTAVFTYIWNKPHTSLK